MKLMTKRDLEQRLELTKLRYERQEIRLYVLLQSMQNNRDNIKQIEYALLVMERVSTQRRRHRIILMQRYWISSLMPPAFTTVCSLTCTSI